MKKLLPLLLCILLLGGCATTYDGPTEMKSVLCEVEHTYFERNGDSTSYSNVEYAYDIYGNMAQTIEYTNDEPVNKSVLRYDEAGRTIKETAYDLTGWFPWPISTAEYTYDEQGRMLTTTYRQGFERSTVTFTYDDVNRTQTITYSGGAYTVQYLDENGHVTRSEHTAANGETSVEEFDRREDGQWLTVRCYRSGVLETVTEYTYDDQGRILTWTETENGEKRTVFRYEYGDGYETCYYEDGTHSTTSYHEDGTLQARIEVDKDGLVTGHHIYRYTEIRVPAEEGVAP